MSYYRIDVNYYKGKPLSVDLIDTVKNRKVKTVLAYDATYLVFWKITKKQYAQLQAIELDRHLSATEVEATATNISCPYCNQKRKTPVNLEREREDGDCLFLNCPKCKRRFVGEKATHRLWRAANPPKICPMCGLEVYGEDLLCNFIDPKTGLVIHAQCALGPATIPVPEILLEQKAV